MSDSIPSIPTPPLRKDMRRVVYAIWAWVALLLGAVIVGWETLESAPKVLYAVNVAWTFIGAGAGFMAKNNVK